MRQWLESRITMTHDLPRDFVMPDTLGRFIWHFASQVKTIIILMLVVEFAAACAQMAVPLLVGALVAGFSAGDPWHMLHTPQFWWAAVFALVLRPLVMIAYRHVYELGFFPAFPNLVRRQLNQYTMGHSIGFFQGDFSGRLASKISEAGNAVRSSISGIIGTSLYAVFVVFCVAGLLFTVHWLLSLFVIAWAGLYAYAGKYFVPKLRKTGAYSSEHYSRALGMRVDAYGNITAVKFNAREDYERARDTQAIHEHNAANLAYHRTVVAMSIFIELSAVLLLGGTVFICFYLHQHIGITGSQIAMVIPAITQLLWMSVWVMNQTGNVFENFGRAEDAMKTLAKAHAVVDTADAKPLAIAQGSIDFISATHRYGKEAGGIKHISLSIPAGQKVGFVGHSGAGKTTLANALVRSFDLEAGEILVDGQNIARVTQNSLRSSITVVSQDPSLLHRTIRENIAYSKPDATDAEIITAARAAHAHDFILGLQDPKGNQGYDALVGERGVRLSGGQRQRISIARALLADTSIIILDEATSALDSASEAAIQENMVELLTGRTVIAIAHRLSTLQMMDRIIVMEQGEVVEDGTHKELLAKKGIYANLWSLQTNGYLPDEAA